VRLAGSVKESHIHFPKYRYSLPLSIFQSNFNSLSTTTPSSFLCPRQSILNIDGCPVFNQLEVSSREGERDGGEEDSKTVED
jgi:hypothetical protein